MIYVSPITILQRSNFHVHGLLRTIVTFARRPTNPDMVLNGGYGWIYIFILRHVQTSYEEANMELSTISVYQLLPRRWLHCEVFMWSSGSSWLQLQVLWSLQTLNCWTMFCAFPCHRYGPVRFVPSRRIALLSGSWLESLLDRPSSGCRNKATKYHSRHTSKRKQTM